ncbi:MAG: hypothetical protein WCF20_03750 [Methylovirgula sp.]
MTDFFTRQARNIISGALAPVEAAGARFIGMFVSMAGIAGVATACLIAALIFLSIALDLWLAQFAGPVVAALGAAGLYLLVAVLCLLLLRARGAKTKQTALPQHPVEAAGKTSRPDLSANIEETVAPFVAILQQTGLKREEIAVRLAAEATKQLGPLTLVALALAVGFLVERSFNNAKTPQ